MDYSNIPTEPQGSIDQQSYHARPSDYRDDRFQIQPSQHRSPELSLHPGVSGSPFGFGGHITKPENWNPPSSRMGDGVQSNLRMSPFGSGENQSIRTYNERQTMSLFADEKPRLQPSPTVASPRCIFAYPPINAQAHIKSFESKSLESSKNIYDQYKAKSESSEGRDHQRNSASFEDVIRPSIKGYYEEFKPSTFTNLKSNNSLTQDDSAQRAASHELIKTAHDLSKTEKTPPTSVDCGQGTQPSESDTNTKAFYEEGANQNRDAAHKDEIQVQTTKSPKIEQDHNFKQPNSVERIRRDQVDSNMSTKTPKLDERSTSNNKRSSAEDASSTVVMQKSRTLYPGLQEFTLSSSSSSKTFAPKQIISHINPADLPPLPVSKSTSSGSTHIKAAPISSPKEPDTEKIIPFVKEEPKEETSSGSTITDIINICEKHVFGQTSSVQIILNICSQATGFPGSDRFCSQIINVCNQILAETYENSHTIIDLCKKLTNLDMTNAKSKVSKAPTQKTKPKIKPTNIIYKDDLEDEELDGFSDEAEDSKDDDFNWKEMVQNSDSEDGLNQEDDPDWSAYWERKKEKRSLRSDVKAETENEVETSEKNKEGSGGEEFIPDDDDDDEEMEEPTEKKSTGTRNSKSSKSSKSRRAKNKTPKIKLQSKRKKTYVKGEFKCTECPKIFLTPRGFEKHQEHHRNGFKITCEVCGVSCPSPSHFKSHMRTHTGEKPFVCEVCGNSYAQMSTLKGHMLLHTDERPAQCEFCDYRCKSNKRLRRHMIIHTSEKKFICDNCGARFLRSASLKKHLQIHKDEWPFPCELCPKKFKSKVHLRRHEEVHRDEYKYQCTVCGKRIRQAGNLKTHMRTHNGDKPYKCDSCGKGFAHNVTRKQHQEQCRGRVEVLIQPPAETDYTKYNPALYMAGLKPFTHLT